MSLSDKFGKSYDDNKDIQTECDSLKAIFSLSDDDLFVKWESFALNSHQSEDTKLSLENLSKLKKQILDDLERSKRNHGSASTPRPKIKTPRFREGVSPVDFLGQLTPGKAPKRAAEQSQTPVKRRSDVLGGTSMSPPKSVTPTRMGANSVTPAGSSTYSSRKDSGSVMESLNTSIPLNPGKAEEGTKITVSDHVQQTKYKFKTMYQKISESSETLDEQIEQYMDWCVESGIVKSNADFKNPTISDQEPIIAAGRIVPDSPTTVRLGDSNVLLETPRSRGGAMRVKLNLSGVSTLSLIPGQLVALKGTNSSGRELIVDEFLTLSPPPFRQVEDVENMPSLTHIVAAGPYTTTKDLDFAPLKDLLAQPADSFVLLGPFIDSAHPLVSAGDFSIPGNEAATMEDLFKHKISPLLNACSAQIVLIPSTRDAVSAHVAFPQPALVRKKLDLNKHVSCRTNPGQFSINELMFATANCDVMRGVAQTEYTKSNPEHIMARAARHVVEQRSLYPLLPGPFAKQPGIPEENQTLTYHHLDKAYLGLCDFVDVTPDIIIMPSQMTPVVRVVSSVVIINPGYLTRVDSGGSYAQITTKPYEGGDAKAWERVRVDLKKI